MTDLDHDYDPDVDYRTRRPPAPKPPRAPYVEPSKEARERMKAGFAEMLSTLKASMATPISEATKAARARGIERRAAADAAMYARDTEILGIDPLKRVLDLQNEINPYAK